MTEQDKPKKAPARASAAKSTAPAPAAPAPAAPEGERIAKMLSRAGVASRREAERLIEAGEVKVNGKIITSPALNVTAKDKVTVSGQPVAEKQPVRLWLYYKPEGLVTSNADEKGRDTVFDHLPEDLPRVMTVGRLDLNSEGLLLLTNDGGLKRRLELPSTGWLRKYRVRIHGNPTDPDFEPLRKGIEVEGERFQPMQVVLDRIQGANAWVTVGLREGKNREIRRAMAAIGLTVNRLIRISYGPFRLNELEPGQVEEVRPRVLKDQLGFDPFAEEEEAPAPRHPPKPGARVRTVSRSGKTRPDEEEAPRAPRGKPAPRSAAATAGRGSADPARPRSAATKPGAAQPGVAKPAGKPGSRLKGSADRFLDAIDTKAPRGRPGGDRAASDRATRPSGPVSRGPKPTGSKPAGAKPTGAKPTGRGGPKRG
ncbi:MAG: pseudouridine synthase [Gemmobacter sp.]|uniref:pseudouridine synthase n=1 Tax=Gemmobacter sp. TaxID=1898957 RepID=UPI001A5AB5E4|nr:pseudouridine synthase [Gemmobacter sp.]MBL8562971.1 pseudouridine synthase [Gemmobacter sp.]